MSASQTSSVRGRRVRWLFSKGEPLPRVSFLLFSFIEHAADSPKHLPGPHSPETRFDPLSIPAVAALLARPEGAVGPFEEVLPLLMRAAHVPLTDRHGPDPVPGEESFISCCTLGFV